MHRLLVCWFPNSLADGSQMGTLSNRRPTAEPGEYRKICLFECLKTEGTALQIDQIVLVVSRTTYRAEGYSKYARIWLDHSQCTIVKL